MLAALGHHDPVNSRGQHVIVFSLLGLLLFINACSIKSMALETTADLLADATQEIETETNFESFRQASPAALKTIEGLAYLEPTNENLLIALTKGYGAYGFGVYETFHLKEKLTESEHTPMKAQALSHYRRSMRYGLRWLRVRGVEVDQYRKALMNSPSEGDQYLSAHLDSEELPHLEGVFFLGQSWLSYINLQRNQPALVAQMFMVKGLFDWVCQRQPDFKFGGCDIFYGAYYSSRPKMLGGDPEKGFEIFQKAVKKFPQNLFIRTALMEYYAIPMMEQEAYNEQKTALIQILNKGSDEVYVPGQEPESLTSPKQSGQIYNSIALQRLRIMRHHDKDLF